ncbi:hypothetical protein GCM10023193_51500 [Planotetraspora kaengkrachanensis]|uniref:NUDIX hydrolase n=1 Tax=Planotetraspora kaengkrachanensis TaxID=575193 RepID=A0A8J3LZY1_9ACTN|nr:hypothetical protein Pka01_26550 [Planotetraspora kaengkrachanensis]
MGGLNAKSGLHDFRRYASRQLSFNDEVRQFHWATPAEVREIVTEAFAVRVFDALSEGAPAVSQHDGVRFV